MRQKLVLAALAVIATLGGWATAEAADRDDYYRYGYYYYPDRSYTYEYYPGRSYTYEYYPGRSYTYYYPNPNRGYTYYYYRDDNRYNVYGDPHRNYLNEYSYNRWDPYGIENHDTN